MKIPNYKILKEIGSGGMGTVYLAERELIGRKVAIKSLKQDLINNEQLKERFKKEATALAKLEHPNIVRLNEYIEQQDGVFLIMEYVDGDADATTIEEVEEAMKLDDRVKEVARAMEISNKAIKLCIEEPDDQELEKKFKTLVAYLKCKEYIK